MLGVFNTPNDKSLTNKYMRMGFLRERCVQQIINQTTNTVRLQEVAMSANTVNAAVELSLIC